MKTLYRLHTEKLGHFYVVAESVDKAMIELDELFEKAEYGFRSDRVVDKIDIVAKELGEFPKGEPNFSSGNNLIIL